MTTQRRLITCVGVLSAALLLGGATPASAANKFAAVNANGTLAFGNGVSSVTYLGPGRYEVRFTTNVSGCSYVTTTLNIYSQAVQSYTAGGHVDVNGVYVEVKNQGGGLMDGSFHLFVACAATGIKYAVVDYNGNLARGSGGTTVTNLSPGRYEVNFLAGIKGCAYLATVGNPTNQLVFNPSGVYTGSGSTTKKVYIETKNPGGGLQAGIPFHLAVICPDAVKTHFAVVNSNGLPKRASAMTSSFNASTGNYRYVTNVVLFPNCATIATRGSVDTAVPFGPATIELTGGPGANTMGIDVRSLLFFGGAAANEAFHVASLCK